MEFPPLYRTAPPRDLPAPRPVVVPAEGARVQQPRGDAVPAPKVDDDGLDVQVTQHAQSGALVTRVVDERTCEVIIQLPPDQVLDMLAWSFATKNLRKDPS